MSHSRLTRDCEYKIYSVRVCRAQRKRKKNNFDVGEGGFVVNIQKKMCCCCSIIGIIRRLRHLVWMDHTALLWSKNSTFIQLNLLSRRGSKLRSVLSCSSDASELSTYYSLFDFYHSQHSTTKRAKTNQNLLPSKQSNVPWTWDCLK